MVRRREPHARPRLGGGRSSAASISPVPGAARRCCGPARPSTRYTIADGADADGRAADPPDGRPHRNPFPRLRLARLPRVLSRLARAGSRRRSSSRWITCCAACSGRSRSTACWWRASGAGSSTRPGSCSRTSSWSSPAGAASWRCARRRSGRRRSSRKSGRAQQAENEARRCHARAVGHALTRGTELPSMLQHCTEALVEHLDGGLARHLDGRRAARKLARARAGAGTDTSCRQHAAHARSALHDRRDRRDAAQLARDADVNRRRSATDWTERDGMVGVRRLSAAAWTSKLIGVLAIVRAARVLAVGARRVAAVADAVALASTASAPSGAGALHARPRAAHETQRRTPSSSRAGRRAAGHAAAGRSGDAREERLPGQHEPRAAHAAERDHPLQRAAAGGSGGQRQRAVDRRPPADPVRRQAPARADQRHPRPLEDRSRQDDAVARDASTCAR